jgi:YegS/Rv2252/BmrU family lipid kinase
LGAPKHILFIVNSATVDSSLQDFRRMVEKHLDHIQYEFDIKFTEKPGDAILFASSAQELGSSICVAVGGDGTVNHVAQSIIGTDIVLGIIPMGSGNGLARHLKISTSAKKAFQVLNHGKIMNMDTGVINSIPFVNIAGAGFDARVANRYSLSGERGFKTYFRIIISEYLNYKPRTFLMDIDGKEVEKKAIFVNFANSSQFGYNTVIAPKAKVNDGLLDLVIVKRFPLQEIPRTTHLLYSHKIDQSEYVEVHQVRKVILERNKGRKVNIDGEAITMDKTLNINVVPSSLQVMAPPDTMH